MKLNRLEAHDRLLFLKKDQSEVVQRGASDCLLKNQLSLALQDKSPYIYIFGHARTADNGVDKRLLWQPRLLKPEAQTNSYLFRAESKTDLLEVCWIIPPREMWGQYKKGNVTESSDVEWSVNNFLHNRKALEQPHPHDLSEDVAKNILRQVIQDHIAVLRMRNQILDSADIRLQNEEEFLTS